MATIGYHNFFINKTIDKKRWVNDIDSSYAEYFRISLQPLVTQLNITQIIWQLTLLLLNDFTVLKQY